MTYSPFVFPVLELGQKSDISLRQDDNLIDPTDLLIGDSSRVVHGIVSEDNKYQISDLFRRVEVIFHNQIEYKGKFFELLGKKEWLALLQNSHVDLARFVKARLLPTPVLFSVLIEGGIGKLEAEKTNIANGGFQVDNPMHIELEYSRYILEDSPRAIQKHNFFSLRHFTEELLEGTHMFGREIEAIARDNRAIYELIQQEALRGKVLVIFNLNYGTDYVGNTITDLISKIPNVSISRSYAWSSNHDNESNFNTNKDLDEYFCPNERNTIEDSTEYTIIVIDGTQFKEGSDRKTFIRKERFPAAMTKVIYDANKGDRYNLKFWIPHKGFFDPSQVLAGWWKSYPKGRILKRRKDLIIVRATGESEGLYDDLSKKQHKRFLRFGSRGVEVATFNITLEQIQERIKMGLEIYK